MSDSVIIRIVCLMVVLPLLSIGGEYEALREAALSRPRRIMVNSDGSDAVLFPKEGPVTPETFYASMLGKLAGAGVDTVCYCVNSFIGWKSKVERPFMGETASEKTKNGIPELFEQGTDTLKLSVDFCRREGMEYFASFRMNDTHDAAWNPQHSNPNWYMMRSDKLDHPDWLLGWWDKTPPYCRWSGWNYAVPEVRARMKALIREVCMRTRPDGVEYDFMRHMQLFKSVAWGGIASESEVAQMTAWMRDLRAMTEELGRQHRRPILVAVRVPDDPAYCRAVGIDLEGWMKEGLIDICIGGAYFQLRPWAESVELAHRYKVRFYPSLGGESRIQRRKGAQFIKGRNGQPYHAATASAAWHQGVDGLYFFNSNYAPPERFRQNVAMLPSQIAFQDKDYYATERGSGGPGPDTYLADGRRYLKMPRIDPGTSLLLIPDGKPYRFTLCVGDDFATAKTAGKSPTATVLMRAPEASKVVFTLRINGIDCGKAEVKEDLLTYAVPLEALHCGNNDIEIAVQLPPEQPLDTRIILNGSSLLEGANQFPWRRIFETPDLKTAESIVKDDNGYGWYRIADLGDGEHQAAGLLYPLNLPTDSRIQVNVAMQLETADTPGAVALRLATGAHTEVVEFMPREIRFRHANRSVAFDTTDAPHSYRFRYDPDQKRFILMDGKSAILSAPALMRSNDPAGWIAGAIQNVEGMHTTSLYIGSLSGPGRGAARWRRLTLCTPSSPLNDFVLQIRYK